MMKSRQLPDEVFEVFGLVCLTAAGRTSLAHGLAKAMRSGKTFDLLRFQIEENLRQRFEPEPELSECEPRRHRTLDEGGTPLPKRLPQWIVRRG